MCSLVREPYNIAICSVQSYPVVGSRFLYCDCVLLTTAIVPFVWVGQEVDSLKRHFYAGSNHVQVFPRPNGHPTVTSGAPRVTCGIQSVNLQRNLAQIKCLVTSLLFPKIQVHIVSSIEAELFVLIITFIFAVNVRVTIISLNIFVRFYDLGEKFEICFHTQNIFIVNYCIYIIRAFFV